MGGIAAYAECVTATATFPTVPARDLQGREVTLPSAFEGRLNVVVVAFRRDHQRLRRTCTPRSTSRHRRICGGTSSRRWSNMRG